MECRCGKVVVSGYCAGNEPLHTFRGYSFSVLVSLHLGSRSGTDTRVEIRLEGLVRADTGKCI